MATLSGLDKVLRNLRSGIKKIEGATAKGLLRGALVVRSASMRLTPVVTGNLRGSTYVSTSWMGPVASSGAPEHNAIVSAQTQVLSADAKGGSSPLVEIGFTAAYALRVHETPSAGKTGRPGASEVGQWKFLLTALRASEARVMELIALEAKRALAGPP